MNQHLFLQQIPLENATIRSIIPEFVLENENFIKNEISGFFNTCLYAFLTTNYSPQFNQNPIQINFTEMFKIFKLYTSINSQILKTPPFYYRTLYYIILHLNKHIDDFDAFFKNKENLFTLEQFLEMIPIIYSAVTLLLVSSLRKINLVDDFCEAERENISKCADQIVNTIDKLRNFNEKYNKINKERINFYLRNFEQNFSSSDGARIKAIHVSNTAVNIKSGNIGNINVHPSQESETISLVIAHSNLNKQSFITQQDYTKIANLFEEPARKNKKETNPKFVPFDTFILNSKTKNYNKTHFTRAGFENYIKCHNLNIKQIYYMLENISFENFETKRAKYENLMEHLDIGNLKEVFNKKFREHTVYLIGSSRSGLLVDISNCKTTIDLLLLPNVYEGDRKNINFSNFINSLGGNIEGILKILQSINGDTDSKSKNQFTLFNLNKIQDSDLANFYCNFDLINNKHPETAFNINLHFYKEKLKLTSDILVKYFFKNPILRALHFFFQEILISKIMLLNNRQQLSYLILAFLNSNYKIFKDENKSKRKCYTLAFNNYYNQNSKYLTKSSLMIENETLFLYEGNQEAYEKLKHIPVGELILEFLRYVTNYFVFLKNDYNRKNNEKFINCKGFDQLNELYFEMLHGKNMNYYALNHDFLLAVYEYHKVFYDGTFCKKVDALEDLYFKICENADKARNITYKVILENIQDFSAWVGNNSGNSK